MFYTFCSIIKRISSTSFWRELVAIEFEILLEKEFFVDIDIEIKQTHKRYTSFGTLNPLYFNLLLLKVHFPEIPVYICRHSQFCNYGFIIFHPFNADNLEY